MITTLLAGMPLAGNDFGDTQSDGVAGPMGLLIIVVLAILTVLLIRNMSARIKRLPQSFDQTPQDQTHSQDQTHGPAQTSAQAEPGRRGDGPVRSDRSTNQPGKD